MSPCYPSSIVRMDIMVVNKGKYTCYPSSLVCMDIMEVNKGEYMLS